VSKAPKTDGVPILPDSLALKRKIKVKEAAEINDMCEATFRKYYSHLIKHLSPRRDGVELCDALAVGETAETLTDRILDDAITMYFGNEVAAGWMIRLTGTSYVDTAKFDPTKHQRASDVRLEELSRVDIEANVAGNDNFHRFLRTVLAVAELTGWDGQGSPLVWLWERKYLRLGDTAYEWTAKATKNKKLRDKLVRLSSLFSPVARRANA
jgi:hypothetical protein